MAKPYPGGIPGFDVSESVVVPSPTPDPTRIAKPKSNDAVTLRGVSVPLNSDVGGAFVTDCARNRERLFSDDQLQEKYEIAPTDWTEIVKNKPLRLAINAECERRTFNGDASREAAAKQFTKAPAILGTILENERNSPRHRIEAAKELRATANVGAEKSDTDGERVVITINLGADEKLVVDSGPLPPKKNKDVSDAEDQW
jgi:hypothetical protein